MSWSPWMVTAAREIAFGCSIRRSQAALRLTSTLRARRSQAVPSSRCDSTLCPVTLHIIFLSFWCPVAIPQGQLRRAGRSWCASRFAIQPIASCSLAGGSNISIHMSPRAPFLCMFVKGDSSSCKVDFPMVRARLCVVAGLLLIYVCHVGN